MTIGDPTVKFLNKLRKAKQDMLDVRPPIPAHQSAPLLKVKPHDPDHDVLIPEPRAKTTSPANSLGKMNDVAFEVHTEDEGTYIHPIDQPITLKNGKALYPHGFSNNHHSLSHAGAEVDIIRDVLKLLKMLFQSVSALLIYIWNLNLYANVSLSNDNNTKIHMPSVVLGLIAFKVVLSIVSSKPQTISNTSSPSSLNIIIICVIIYLIATLMKDQKSETETGAGAGTGIGLEIETAFNTADAKSVLTPEAKKRVKTTKSSIPPKLPNMNEFNKIGSKEFRNPQRSPITEYDIIHRQDHQRKNGHLNLNLPVKKDSITRHVMNRMTDNGREEMMKLFA